MTINNAECSKCGCRGIHACIGYRMQPMTDKQVIELREAIKTVADSRKSVDVGFWEKRFSNGECDE